MSIHLHKFIDRVCGAEARGAKDLSMSMVDAKNLHADITRLLIELQNMKQILASTTTVTAPISVEIQGGTFK